jgi:hypothetical protein
MSRPLSHRILRLSTLVLGMLAALTLAACMSVAVKLPGEPLPPEQLRTRIETRQFATDFIERVTRAADLVAEGSEDADLRANALRWKIGASVASRRSAYRSDPTLALVDTWALALQMNDFFTDGAGSALFGNRYKLAADTAAALARDADALAARRLETAVLTDARNLVTEYAAAERLGDLAFERAPIAQQWRDVALRHLARSVSVPPEAQSEAADQFDVYSRRIPDELRWRTELAFLESGVKPSDLAHALRRFDEELTKLGVLAQTQPELAMQRLDALQAEMTRVFASFDQRWGQTLDLVQDQRAKLVMDLEAMRVEMDATIERERKALYAAISSERAALAADVSRIGKELGPLLLAKLGDVVAEALLLLILVVLVLIGLPFLAGFITGRATTRRSQQSVAKPGGGP